MAQHKYVVTIYTGTPCLTRLKLNYMHQLQTIQQYWWALVHSWRQISITKPLKTNHASQQEVPPAHPEGEQTKYNLSSNSSMGCYVDVLILQRQILFSETESQQPANVAHPCHTAPMLCHTSNALLKWWRKRKEKQEISSDLFFFKWLPKYTILGSALNRGFSTTVSPG